MKTNSPREHDLQYTTRREAMSSTFHRVEFQSPYAERTPRLTMYVASLLIILSDLCHV